MNQMVTQNCQWQLDLVANCQGLEGEIENNHENGKEYEGITKTPYQHLMLERQVMRTKERPTW